MKKLFGLVLLALAAARVSAAGLIIVGDDKFWEGSPVIIHPTPPVIERRIIVPPRPAPSAPIEVSYTKADVKIKDQFATTKVEQEFYNPNARRLEGTFLFPVPKGAQLDKFTMNINGKPVEAELLNADKARAIYEDIVRRQRDPALLEYAGQALFKVRIFPIEPHERKKITLSYSQLLKSDAGLVGYTLPLNTEKFTAKPLRSVSVKLELESKRALKSIYSPTHAVSVKRDGAHKAAVGFEASDVNPSGDFQVFYTQDDAELGVNLLTYKKDGEDGYFLLLASPGAEQRNTQVMQKDVVFVLDTSGSMQGAKLAQAKKALAFCVENLNDGDRFEVLSFATEVDPLFNNLRDATKENRGAAQKFIETLKPIGGTAIDDALKKAVALRPEGGTRPYVIVFLTDGRPTVGTVDENQILAGATKSKTGLTRIFCFGIGTDVNTHLLDKIAEETKAFSTYVLPEEDIEVKVSSFFTKIKEPVLASPVLKFPEILRVTKVYPAPLPDVFKGEQVIVAGRYTTGGDGAIQIKGQMGGDQKRFAYDVKFARESTEHDFIPRLWATRRVGYLLDEIRLRGESKELRDEVTELARQYAIVTPYTAYLIIEDEQRRNVPAQSQTLRRSTTTDRLGLSGEAAATRFYKMQKDKAGDAAVAGSRSLNTLKQANTPGEAIASGNYDVYRGESRLSSGVATFNASGGAVTAPAPAAAAAYKAEAQQTQNQGRYAGGKTFFQHGARWVDADVQKQNNAKRARVQFASPEYFDLIAKQPQTKSWLAVGANVEFTIGETIYEVTE